MVVTKTQLQDLFRFECNFRAFTVIIFMGSFFGAFFDSLCCKRTFVGTYCIFFGIRYFRGYYFGCFGFSAYGTEQGASKLRQQKRRG